MDLSGYCMRMTLLTVNFTADRRATRFLHCGSNRTGLAGERELDPLGERAVALVADGQSRGAVADQPALPGEDTEEDAVREWKSGHAAVLEAKPEGVYITADVSPEQVDGLSPDSETKQHDFGETTAGRLGAAALSAVDGVSNREPGAATSHSPVRRSPNRRLPDSCRLHQQLMLVL